MERGGGTETGKEESFSQIPLIIVRPKTEGGPQNLSFHPGTPSLESGSSGRIFLVSPQHCLVTIPSSGPNAAPFKTQDSSERSRFPPSPVQHSGQLPATLRGQSPEIQDASPHRTRVLFKTEAPLPCPSHTRSRPPGAPGIAPFLLCPKKEKKPRHEASLREPRERTPPTSFQP